MNTPKKLTLILLTLLLAATAWAADSTDMTAARKSVDCLSQFYASLAELPSPEALDHKTTADFILNNAETIIALIARAKAGNDIAKSDQIIKSMARKTSDSHAYTTDIPVATDSIYYDEITKHIYVKVEDDTYAEYTRKGEFFRNVSSRQPHLAKSPYVRPIDGDSYFLYVKGGPRAESYLTLPAQETHPKGWALKKALVALE